MSTDGSSGSSSQDIQLADSLVQRIATAATGPQSISGDAGSVTNYPVRDLITSANYLYGLAARQSPAKGVMFTRLIPDATVQGPRRCFSGQPGWRGGWNGYGWP